MLSVHGRKPAAVVVVPVAKLFLKVGLTPNVVTVVGTIVTIAISVILIPLDHLFAAALLSGLFAAFDMLDGTMARLTTGGSNFGATLDASCDRITDGALFAAIAYWMVYVDNAHPLNFAACMVVLVSSQVISYVKARGEASGFKMVGGLVERPERLILGLGGVGLEGLGVPYALEVALWLLAVGSVFTIYQRMRQAARQDTKARFKKELKHI
ncbi:MULTISPECIES: phosphatidylinositol phosphate synthase [Corynebacterium]|uniref:Phosphatidylinositol phosphate synthase n=1 Tax=Corynebacterium aurimucosum TaxID=169292 RepID=A0A558GKU7_9CORY|nr:MULTISPECIES: CDP-alcohol phosphatidyltransferase family protein [Corynebacterium]MBU5653397.1 CDP-alcohol phosphatidyltransferase family protein [Corynebacterium aurimucosum]OFL24807.1 phosphatidylglycerophosphate synthase [Corynebacterium sp. HMSC062A03]OFS37638.1 phosphatidylglycerophosphate synthase [Corynebacterium sp. HMSC069E04]OFT65149.1 phosphatidylglycerophosphate synthase [Corynebacterium sp. HMSC05D03]QQU94777.1 CDP-alcohol phosphatidyltransferase family protein [Corynebacterium